MPRTLGFVVVSRSDWAIVEPILTALTHREDCKRFVLLYKATDMLGERVLSVMDALGVFAFESFKLTKPVIDHDALWLGENFGALMQLFTYRYPLYCPDILVLSGDRWEMAAASCAAVPHGFAMAHIHGGEETTGSLDNVWRWTMTCQSHLHFAATQDAYEALLLRGEDPWRVYHVGTPLLDTVRGEDLPSWEYLREKYALSSKADTGFLLCTYHPNTSRSGDIDREIHTLLDALSAQPLPVVFTAPNNDGGWWVVTQAIEAAITRYPTWSLIGNCGTRDYHGFMKYATAMVGNSSSGFTEAPHFGLLVLNVGDRQQGRPRHGRIIDCPFDAMELASLLRTLAQKRVCNPLDVSSAYSTLAGSASGRIVDVLSTVELTDELRHKRYA